MQFLSMRYSKHIDTVEAVFLQTDCTTICTHTILVSGTTTVPLFIFLFLSHYMNLKMQRKLPDGAV